MSAQTQGDATPWIDTKFVGGMNTEIHAMLSQRGVNVTGERMDAPEMSNYKYQIDYGGGGGTTWEGTLTKLLMPGVLFHHESKFEELCAHFENSKDIVNSQTVLLPYSRDQGLVLRHDDPLETLRTNFVGSF